VRVHVNGTELWFDVDGPALVPDGSAMRERPTVLLVHGGPGSYDHSYFTPYFGRLTDLAQVVYLDLRGHGRSARTATGTWTFETCADDVRAFCDALGITAPLVLGHSWGGCIALLYAARHPGHAGALILQSTMARFDLDRLVDGFRRVAGPDVAALAQRDYSGDPVTDEQWSQVFTAFGPTVPGTGELARRIGNPELGVRGMQLLRSFDAVDQLARVTCPTLVCVGRLDPVTPVAAAYEIARGLPAEIRHLEVIPGAGHFPWLDRPDDYWALLGDFITTTTS
jgi:pimeloyl-ACP methyl ester carboxylesterase